MAAQGITASLLALAALTHAADTAHKNDARLFYDDKDTSVTISGESLFYIGVTFVGLLLLTSFPGLFGTSANNGYGAPAPVYDERTMISLQQFIEDAVKKFLQRLRA
ncbi:uncharacterized protein LOC119593637 [Penaeus monodon]|uniref:uncharacterized protein LOC119593637 n=1 Tax=Penaeus monodon TaxID=6687 RepID=UPI0018A70A04|nr:uncharacterized protein LOC119593637 [Penaeus monodon]